MERKPDQSYVLANLELVDCLLRGGAQKGLWDPVDPPKLERAVLETCTNGVVLRVWLRTPLDVATAARGIRERSKEEAEEAVASLEKTLLGTGPLTLDEEETLGRGHTWRTCVPCAGEGKINRAPEDESKWIAAGGWRTLDGVLHCPRHAEAKIRAAGRGLRERPPIEVHQDGQQPGGGASKLEVYIETPESLHVLLVSLLPEGTVPPLWKIREWYSAATPAGSEAFDAVSAWAQREHAWATPIKGHEPPPKLPFPLALIAFRDEPHPKKPNGKKPPKAPAQKAPAKKRIRTRKARPSDVPPATEGAEG